MRTNYELLIGKFIILAACCVLSADYSCAQDYKKKEKEIIAIGAGMGILTFHGDVGKNSIVGDYSYIRSGFSFSIEKYLTPHFSLSANMLKGKIARDEKASDNLPKLNFESPVTQFGISGSYLLTGKKEKAYPVIPYLSAGISFLLFDPHGDLMDKNGNPYYYWTDGSIRDLPEAGMNFFYAQNIERDYKYETKLTDSTSNYSRSTVSLPISAGIKMKLTPRIDANLGLTYHLSFSDYLDNVKSGGNDGYLYSSVSLNWHLFRLPKEVQEQYSNIDFAAIDKSDTDKDGIPDVNDLCPNNPKGIKVDGRGCPIDSDADGVPDYLDKEPNSKGGLPVDINGVELTKQRMAEMQKASNAKAAMRKEAISEAFNKKPSAEFMKQVEEMQMELRKDPNAKPSTSKIPHDLQIADWNKDGFIASDEIAKTIDAFFDGTIMFNAEQIHRLIDFFFEQ
jgi:hypothetical protein